jgi:hypothetical protein
VPVVVAVGEVEADHPEVVGRRREQVVAVVLPVLGS